MASGVRIERLPERLCDVRYGHVLHAAHDRLPQRGRGVTDYGRMRPEDRKILEIFGIEPTWRDDGDPLSLYCNPHCHGIVRSVHSCDRCGNIYHVCVPAEHGLCSLCIQQN